MHRELPSFFVTLHRLLEDLRLIEETADTTLSLSPFSISSEEIWAISQVGYIPRHGHSTMNFEQITVDVDPTTYDTLENRLQGALRMVLPLQMNLFGEKMLLGYLTGHLEPDESAVARATPATGAEPPAWTVRLAPTNERARSPVFAFSRDEPDFAVAVRDAAMRRATQRYLCGDLAARDHTVSGTSESTRTA